MIVKVFYFDAEAMSYKHTANVTLTNMPKNHEDALERAYEATQNIEGSWSRGESFEFDGKVVKNPDYNRVHGVTIEVVEPLPVYNGNTYGHRSSMMGDRFVIGDNTYKADFIGFKSV